MKVNKAYRFRIYPNKKQETFLANQFGGSRFIYNYFLNNRKEEYLNNKKSLNYHDDAKALTSLKEEESYKWLNELNAQGRLFVAGPMPAIDSEEPGKEGFTGSTVIAEFDSLAEAQRWADADPYIEAGVYSSVIVKPFKKVLPA